MKRKDVINSIIGALIGVLVLSGIIYAIFGKGTVTGHALDVSPAYMKVLGAICFLIGGTSTFLLATQRIGTGNEKRDIVAMYVSIIFATVFAWLVATNFYNGVY